MKYLRVAWVVLAILVIGMDAVSIPFAYEQAQTLCKSASCNGPDDERLAPDEVRELRELGLSTEFYAGGTVGLEVIGVIAFSTVSIVIFLRGSGDRMALLTSFTLLIFGGAAFNSDLPEALATAHPALQFPVDLLDYVGQVAFSTFFFVFPDGRFVPRWTRWLALLWALLFIPNTFFPGSSLDILGGSLFVGYVITLVIVQVYRYLRVSDPTRRQQTKWVVFGSTVAIGGFVFTLVVSNLFPPNQQNYILAEILQGILIYSFILLIPFSIGIAILRHRLYDIDVIINRTLVYLSLTAALALVYFGSVVSLQYVFRNLTGNNSQIVIVASTLAIAALFNPLRYSVQAFVDRRFYRGKYDAAETLREFSGRLRDETDIDTLNDELVAVVGKTMKPEHISLWLRDM